MADKPTHEEAVERAQMLETLIRRAGYGSWLDLPQETANWFSYSPPASAADTPFTNKGVIHCGKCGILYADTSIHACKPAQDEQGVEDGEKLHQKLYELEQQYRYDARQPANLIERIWEVQDKLGMKRTAAPSVEREPVLPGDCACRYWARSFQMNMNYECSPDLHHPNCDGFGGHKSGVFDESKISAEAFTNTANDQTPELSLLLIDLGDSCVVKMETEGTFPHIVFADGSASYTPGARSFHYDRPFTEVRAAIDAIDAATVPRIEEVKDAPWRLITSETSDVTLLYRHEMIALNKLAGHPLPIYSPKPGVWQEHFTMGAFEPNECVRIYRFTR